MTTHGEHLWYTCMAGVSVSRVGWGGREGRGREGNKLAVCGQTNFYENFHREFCCSFWDFFFLNFTEENIWTVSI